MTPEGKYELTDVEFKEMSEDDAVRVFTEDGYFKYAKRTQRYEKLPSDGIFATSPSTHFVLFEKDTGKPLGVVGYSKYKNILLGAGIHTRKDMEGKGIASLLANKLMQEKGSKLMVVSFAKERAKNMYIRRGFKEVDLSKLPPEVVEEIQTAEAQGNETLSKMLMLIDNWWGVLRGY